MKVDNLTEHEIIVKIEELEENPFKIDKQLEKKLHVERDEETGKVTVGKEEEK